MGSESLKFTVDPRTRSTLVQYVQGRDVVASAHIVEGHMAHEGHAVISQQRPNAVTPAILQALASVVRAQGLVPVYSAA